MAYELQIFGGIGALILLIAFSLLEFNKIKKGVLFNLLNLVGSLILLVYGYLLQGYVFVALNAVWALVSLYKIIKN